MKLAISVQSCAAYKDRREAIRKTWLKDVPRGIDTFFFVGGTGAEDATRLECGDRYEDCARKQIKSIERLKDYDYVFFCDDDTYVVPDRLFLCGFENHDYMGCPCPIDGTQIIMAQGGAGFWLSNKAMNKILAQESIHNFSTFPESVYSDRMVGTLAHLSVIHLHGDMRFNLGKYNGERGFCNLVPNLFNKYITSHFVSPQKMEEVYAHFKEGLVLPNNCYTMNINGKRVDFSEKSGRWWYFVWGGTQFKGEFDFAHLAEIDAFNYSSKDLV